MHSKRTILKEIKGLILTSLIMGIQTTILSVLKRITFQTTEEEEIRVEAIFLAKIVTAVIYPTMECKLPILSIIYLLNSSPCKCFQKLDK